VFKFFSAVSEGSAEVELFTRNLYC